MILSDAERKSRAGSLLVLAILLFGVGAAIVAISYQRTQTQKLSGILRTKSISAHYKSSSGGTLEVVT